MLLELAWKGIVRFFGSVLPMVVRWRYKPSRLAELVRVRLDSEGEGLEFWAGDLPHYEGWLVVQNGTPFTIELTSLSGSLFIGPGLGQFISLKRVRLKPGAEESLHFRANLTIFELSYLKRQKSQASRFQLNLCAQFFSEVNAFQKEAAVTSSHFAYKNFESPISTWVQLEDQHVS